MSSEPLTYETLWGTPPPDAATDESGHMSPQKKPEETDTGEPGDNGQEGKSKV